MERPEAMMRTPPTMASSLTRVPWKMGLEEARVAASQMDPCQQKRMGAARIMPMP